MLNERKIARSYAAALFDLAVEQRVLEEVYSNMMLIGSVLAENPELHKVLSSPVLRNIHKAGILEALFNQHIKPLTMRFLHLLIKANRGPMLKGITQQFDLLYKVHHGIVSVAFRSAAEVSGEIKQRVIAGLERDLGKKVEMVASIDPKLIGGYVIQVEDKRYDASVRAKLNKLDRQFDINMFKKEF